MECIIAIQPRTGKDQELHQTLLTLVSAMRDAPGCRDSRLYQDIETGEHLLLTFGWDDSAALQKYLRTENGSAILGAIDLLGESVKVQLGADKSMEGIELLKQMRSNQ